MRLSFLIFLFLAFLPATPAADSQPFVLTIVPSRSPDARYITIADEQPDVFYVILSNTSNQPQPVWETQFSWGYWTISFELITPDGKTHSISKTRDAVFTRNIPATFMIPPGEHKVYAVRLDKEWLHRPTFPEATHTAIRLKAIYSVSETPESTKYKVWSGRIESKIYDFTLSNW